MISWTMIAVWVEGKGEMFDVCMESWDYVCMGWEIMSCMCGVCAAI
jgi:hypothetical protein